MIAIRTVGKSAAAAKAEAHQLAVDAGVDQVTGGRYLRPRGAVGQVTARIRRRRVELQRCQRKVVELAHRAPVMAIWPSLRRYGRHPVGGRVNRVYQFGEMSGKPDARYRAGTEGCKVRGLLLAIDQGYAQPL